MIIRTRDADFAGRVRHNRDAITQVMHFATWEAIGLSVYENARRRYLDKHVPRPEGDRANTRHLPLCRYQAGLNGEIARRVLEKLKLPNSVKVIVQPVKCAEAWVALGPRGRTLTARIARLRAVAFSPANPAGRLIEEFLQLLFREQTRVQQLLKEKRECDDVRGVIARSGLR